ncbi:hypothetical protein L6164_007408 [Bauhinia variegata]|uniref:Uncharacterized protein n=1 Tax=Bauhinia variegata TaxID=167791 RepID=A0ACB9PDL0_BAUVA|nr:hypothetical protein L6164_007408 [Bauhinia variegata]
MGPDLELKGESKTVPEVLVSKEDVGASPFSEEKHFEPANAHGTDVLPIEQTPLFNANEDVEVNITGITNSGKALAVEAVSENVTECSSSFGDTGLGTENDSAFSDAEVESRIFTGSASPPTCDVLCKPLRIRKKKLTTHWRGFVSPLMWRCKWIELQLMQLQSQELKYKRELAAYDCRKQDEFANFTINGFDTKSVPLSGWHHRNKVMERKKRKRVEEESDLKSYMSNHNLFSYYENKGGVDGAYSEDVRGVVIACNADDSQEFGLNNIWSSLDSRDSDKSFEDMIKKIEAVDSQVEKLRSRIDKVVNENPGKFHSVSRGMIGLADGLNCSDLNHASTVGNYDAFPISPELRSVYDMEALFMPKNAMSNCEEMTSLLIEATKTSQLEVPCEDTKDGILVHNQAAKEEKHNDENIRNQLAEKTKVGDEMPHVPSKVKPCSTSKSNIPRNAKKRKRKASSKRWSRRRK